MNIQFLIDSITQQTTVLIAQLATTGGMRAPLAHIANQVFLELSRELNELGVGRKVAADMFGMALRSYHAKIRRLEEGASEPARRSLWEAVYDFIEQRGPVRQQDILTRFRHDDDASVRSVLLDLVETGLVYQSGSLESRVYRGVPEQDLRALTQAHQQKSFYWAIWMYIYRTGPLTGEQLRAQLKVDEDVLTATLDELLAEQRIQADEHGAYSSSSCTIPMGKPAGWEAALFDHFCAMTTSMLSKLREMRAQTMPTDEVGGSTYTLDVWPGHPMRDEVRSLLRDTRARLTELNQRVCEHNAAQELAREELEEVIFYFGQTVRTSAEDPAPVE